MNDPWIYLVLLGAVVMVCGLLRPKTANGTTTIKQEIEDTLEHYIEEMAAENDKLLTVVERMKKEQNLRDDSLRKRMDLLEGKIAHLTEKQQLQNHHVEARITNMQQQSVRQRDKLLPMADEHEHSRETSVSTMESNSNDIHSNETEMNSLITAAESEELPSIRKRYKDIFELLDEGISSHDIALQLNLPQGEVEVIIQLGLQEAERV